MPKILGRKHAEIEGTLELAIKGQFWNRRRSFSECFYVLADSINQFEDEILATTGLPLLGNVLSGCFHTRKKAEEVASVVYNGAWTTLWEVKCDYTSNIDQDQIDTNADPTQRRPKRRWYTVKEEVNLEKDVVTGQPIKTQADEPFSIPDVASFHMLEITRYEPYPFDPLIQHRFENSCNELAFYGAPPGAAFMDTIESEEETIERELYQKTMYLIKFKIEEDDEGNFKEDTMSIFEALHQGYQYRPSFGPSYAPKIKLDSNGQPIRINLYYDPAGVADGVHNGGIELPPTFPPSFIPFSRKRKKDWTSLQLEF